MGISAAGYAAAALAVSVVGTVYSISQQNAAAEEQAKANKKGQQLQQKRANLATSRERAKQVRQGRIARAQALAQSQSGEATGGSGLAGVQANIGGAAVRSANFLNQNQQISSEISNLNIKTSSKVAKHGTRAAIGAGIASVAQTSTSVFGQE